MMKKIYCILIGITLMFLISGCMNKDEVAKELIEYHNNDWIKVQKMKDAKISSKITMYTAFAMEDNEEAIANLLNEEILPSHNEILEYLKEIELDSNEIEELNLLQIEAETFGYEIFQEQAKILNDGNKTEINEMFNRFEIYDKALEDKYEIVYEKRKELMEKYNVQWVKEYDDSGDRIMKMRKDDD